jgi:hypothetical protein
VSRPRHAHNSVFDENDDEDYVPSSRQSRLSEWEKTVLAEEEANAEIEAREIDSHRRNMFAG